MFDVILESTGLLPGAELVPKCSTLRNRTTAQRLSNEQQPTLHMVIPCRQKLLQVANSLLSNEHSDIQSSRNRQKQNYQRYNDMGKTTLRQKIKVEFESKKINAKDFVNIDIYNHLMNEPHYKAANVTK
ncbi:unnamed protein product [Rotaria magnacalcarata]|uniref:Uncharacterized protein n=1 Tax=Rotaria magnacalcarata TaxID=392030 RepID=A0A819VNH3_9BILA|nr:unnamed protein product [Rotaria magnacalcarata]CAF4215625.1 unnamed protein product [Rotaria magnacalcarata]